MNGDNEKTSPKKLDDQTEKVICLPRKRPPSVVRFCKKIRISRGNRCENCGCGPDQDQVESHHILDFHDFPSLAKDEQNIVVLCQRCHGGLSNAKGGERLIAYGRLKRDLRERIASYVEAKAPELSTFSRIVRQGEEAATEYFFRRLEM